MIKIEALEPVLVDRLSLDAGDRISVDDDVALDLCSNGWAKSVNGEIDTGERVVVKATISAHGSSQNVNTYGVKNG